MSGIENARAFRKALGAFATGVTIVTTRDANGEPIGVTASSFNSVSLDPPLVLWSLAKSSLSRQAFSDSGYFAVHVLAEGQEHMADRFARSGEDKFAGLDWDHCERGSPLFNDFAARFECQLVHEYDGGDHVILVGEVNRFDTKDHPPLLYHGGSYGQFRELDRSAEEPGKPSLTGPNS
ncbi:flavin reductase family protein [Altererythrobacter sp. GH1-8]|uniref:flavin reductase family protein n=1 Tax=Altererythrobacter sp. GH1-8 TaxID=3349333 RepID=UPI00374D4691